MIFVVPERRREMIPSEEKFNEKILPSGTIQIGKGIVGKSAFISNLKPNTDQYS